MRCYTFRIDKARIGLLKYTPRTVVLPLLAPDTSPEEMASWLSLWPGVRVEVANKDDAAWGRTVFFGRQRGQSPGE